MLGLACPRLNCGLFVGGQGSAWADFFSRREKLTDLPYGYKFFVDDGSGGLTIFVNTQTGIDLTGLTAGRTVQVTGFSSQFDTHYEIDPRFQADVTLRHR
ncbi:hypothetical protein L3Q67_19215 [Saccharothrix sp. AJ9571]|nr:hypothetical protein L3Q67_19215 [Saccharothrix sp. AJ9571]